ncbi:AMP-binding protein [Dethiobacter alkaliphilus]|uniref:AMP-dependent synthetase and ligase n=1 Tax=Dethiobacter alkaliphilus AHT 1 TaxID=555088 RepID=C0GHS2_DETAL|nr:AMP-binding protein [Dethiobacter alkaliphilus]EEG76996.1 AMP-dependent synthetase and ligase [Dethiobacter alkaliphilus AHT 1]
MANMKNYEETYQNFKLEVPEYFNWATDEFDRWGKDPDKLGLWVVDDFGNETKLTFAELTKLSCKLANVFRANNIQEGDKIITILGKIPSFWVTMLASLRSGVVVSPGTGQLTAKDIQYRFDASGAVAIIVDEEMAAKVDAVAADCPTLKTKIVVGKRDGWLSFDDEISRADGNFEATKTKADDNAILYFTSGTTGMPKMTVHTHASYGIGHRITGKFWLDLTENDVHWNLSDTGWAKAAWSSFFGPWNCGATIFAHDSTGKFDGKRILEMLSDYPITTLCGPPTAYRVFVQDDLSKYNFKSLRHCVAAGEPLNPEVINVWKEATGTTIYDGYGQTETVLLVANFPCNEVKVGSMGKTSPGFYVAMIDEDGKEVPAGQEGDIAVRIKPERPVGLFKEYYNEPERTAATVRGDWYVTGDRGIRDEDGYVWFVGRADDLILSSGYRIGPFEVESALIEHDAVAESAVVASPDEVRGEIVKAFVILAPGYEGTPELVKELQNFVKNLTAPYKYPREIEFVESLPKTVSGKIRRIELRDMEKEKKLNQNK